MRERKKNRLSNYDYSSPGAYFITICVHNRECLFGHIIDNKMRLNEFGLIVDSCWHDLPNHYSNIILDEFIIMPNHVHGIIQIVTNVNVPMFQKKHGLSEIIRGFKTFSSRKINEMNMGNRFKWQKSYYDRIVRYDWELNRIRKYIIHNPIKWDLDVFKNQVI